MHKFGLSESSKNMFKRMTFSIYLHSIKFQNQTINEIGNAYTLQNDQTNREF